MLPLHSRTEHLVSQLRISAPQSLLLSGSYGIGLTEIASLISEGYESTFVAPDDSKASRPITTEMIRHLYETTRAKSQARQYVIIQEADAMTHAAQGAFLKLLEEPNVAIHFILTSSHPDILLPTIRSRVQHHAMAPITRQQSEDYLTTLGVTDSTTRQQLLYIAEGLPAELSRLVSDTAHFQQSVQHIKDARSLLQSPVYERLLIAHRYRDNRANALELIQFATTMTRRTISTQPAQALIAQLEKLLAASEQLKANSNVRLTLTRLVL